MYVCLTLYCDYNQDFGCDLLLFCTILSTFSYTFPKKMFLEVKTYSIACKCIIQHFRRVLWSLEGHTSQNKEIKEPSFFSDIIRHAECAKYGTKYGYFEPFSNKK